MCLWCLPVGLLGSGRPLGRWGEDGSAQEAGRAPRRPGPAGKNSHFCVALSGCVSQRRGWLSVCVRLLLFMKINVKKGYSRSLEVGPILKVFLLG